MSLRGKDSNSINTLCSHRMLAHLARSSSFVLQQQQRCFSRGAFLLKGHSKWQNIKDTKGKNDALRARQISYLLTKVKSAVKSGGFDMKLNQQLVAVQQEFRAQSLPLETFNNYLAKMKSKPDVTAFFELMGPSGSFFIIETETDSVNRTKADVTKYLKKVGGFQFASNLRKRFDEKLVATVSSKNSEGKELSLEEVEEIAIELDCEEVTEPKEDQEELGHNFELKFDLQNMVTLENSIKEKGLQVDNVEQRLIPIHKIELTSDEKLLVDKFYTVMQEVAEINNIYDNLN